jgi:nucleoside-diphosphate-sugar epimerase
VADGPWYTFLMPSKLIIGCGYLGRHVARRWLAEGADVVGLTRDAAHAASLAAEGIRPLVADVTRPKTLRGLPPAETMLFAVGFDPAAGYSRSRVYVDGLRAALDAMPPNVARVILISSTGVYGDAAGGEVDEDSPCRPVSEGGRALLAAEETLAQHRLGRVGIVLRLAGLYGFERLPQVAALRAGKPLAVRHGSWVNLVHVEDAAAVVLAAEKRAVPPRTFVVSDGHPAERRAFQSGLAQSLGLPPPTFVDPPGDHPRGGRGDNSKRVRNSRMLRELGVTLQYPDYRAGLGVGTL